MPQGHQRIVLLATLSPLIEPIRKETQSDQELVMLMNTILNGWPCDRQECHTSIRHYWDVKDELSVAE